uniref:Uncharacterized protein n=1 Tax=Talaromyces marneffei PM1 TaxID=1077442 RepID=A0A093USR4_TALMA
MEFVGGRPRSAFRPASRSVTLQVRAHMKPYWLIYRALNYSRFFAISTKISHQLSVTKSTFSSSWKLCGNVRPSQVSDFLQMYDQLIFLRTIIVAFGRYGDFPQLWGFNIPYDVLFTQNAVLFMDGRSI